jgi:hypothetical protein
MCSECGSKSFRKDEMKGEKACEDCGLVIEDDAFDTNTPYSEVDERGRLLGPHPTVKQGGGLRKHPGKRPGDREWTLPQAKTRGLAKKKRDATDRIGELQEQVDKIEARREQIDLEIEKEKSERSEGFEDRINLLKGHRRNAETEHAELMVQKIRPLLMRLNSSQTLLEDDNEWMVYQKAKYLLGLGLNEGENAIADRIKELKPDVIWFALNSGNKREPGFIVDDISKPGIPERAPRDESGTRMWAPAKERMGIEVYANLTARERGFWFFGDYIKRLGLNDRLVERILEEGLPVSSQLTTQLRDSSDLSPGSGGSNREFIDRFARLMGASGLPPSTPSWLDNPPKPLWRRLALSKRGSVEDSPLPVTSPSHRGIMSSRLHYWVMRQEGAGGKGWVRRHSNPLIFRHIPIAYYIAQECWCRRIPGYRLICVEILQKIAEDLEWCAASVEEMDAWWDSTWKLNYSKHNDDTESVIKLRHE